MKTALFILSLAIFFYVGSASAQSVHLVPNPDNGLVLPDPLYRVPLVYNNKLYYSYTYDYFTYYLSVYDAGSLKVIANPGATTNTSYAGGAIGYNNNVYLSYTDQSGNYNFYSYNGSALTLVPNPPNGTSGVSSLFSVLYNNKLYSVFNDNTLTAFDGTGFTLTKYTNVQVPLIIFNGKICMNYGGHVGVFNGDTLISIANPSNTGFIVSNIQSGFPLAYNNRLYEFYTEPTTSKSSMASFDGSTLSVISNPDDGGFPSYYPIGYNGKVYVMYHNASNVDQLAEYNGTSFKLIPNPAGTQYTGSPIVYNNTLYLYYKTPSGPYQLDSYDGTTLRLVPDVNGGSPVQGQNIVFNNKLYLGYNDASRNSHLAIYDGNSYNVLPNPPGGAGATYFSIFNQKVYFVSGGHLAYVDETVLPVTLLNSSVQLQNKHALVQWQTAAAYNGNKFTIQRSEDGINFTDIRTVKAIANSNAVQSYSFTDPADPVQSKLFYRIQELDNDGKIQFSNILSIDFPAVITGIVTYPNPANTVISLDLHEALKKDASMVLYDLSGKLMLQQKLPSGSLHNQIIVNKLAPGSYRLVVIEDGKKVFSTNQVIVR